MGKVLIDKLLRRTEVDRIYMLMRVKKGKEPKERLVDVFTNPVGGLITFMNLIMFTILAGVVEPIRAKPTKS